MNRSITSFLAGIHPLSDLPSKELEEVGSLAGEQKVSAGEILVLDQEDRVALYYIMEGSVQLFHGKEAMDTLIQGDFFGNEAFFSFSPLVHSAVALEDCTLAVLPEPVFQRLMQHGQVNNYFQRKTDIFRNRINYYLSQRKAYRIDPYLRLTLRDIQVRQPVFIHPETTVARTATIMQQERVSSCLVQQEGAFPGIVTQHDILEKVVAGDLDPKVVYAGQIMSSPLITARSNELLFQALSRMVRHGVHRLVVLDNRDRTRGIIEERDLISIKGENPVHLSGEIARSRDMGSLGRIFQQVQGMVLRSVAEGTGVLQVGRLISDFHDQILARLHELILQQVDQSHQDSFCILVLGSEGRKEQYMATDQDNALIYAGDPGRQGLAFYELFADKFIQALTDLGFPPCPHQVMINNPEWRMSLDEWLDTVDEMAQKADTQSILKTSLLLDMRPVAGDEKLAGMLRSYLFRRVARSSFLLKYMANEAVRFMPPLGFFSKLLVEKSGENKGKMDIKKGGVFPLIHGVRTLSAEHGILDTSTEERITRLHESGVFSAGFCAGLREAYEFFQTLRVKNQVEQIKKGVAPDNWINPDDLSGMERDRLKECFRVVLEFQNLLNNKYSLRLLA
ncbi:putative nucleotidyltransferase substrate binding domain-containing protein [Desulfonatronospira sp.]|uniref:putative nucleotidyltransferase substrate binding domain-containing protein n=1 Tax=Desulfonatronospira sp. TaxID=1962951 RepID=UPI0025B98514|nr:putative nucleotidyltransferase substrate binding domain-containing protein [Desulfonatronospira sp.]